MQTSFFILIITNEQEQNISLTPWAAGFPRSPESTLTLPDLKIAKILFIQTTSYPNIPKTIISSFLASRKRKSQTVIVKKSKIIISEHCGMGESLKCTLLHICSFLEYFYHFEFLAREKNINSWKLTVAVEIDSSKVIKVTWHLMQNVGDALHVKI